MMNVPGGGGHSPIRLVRNLTFCIRSIKVEGRSSFVTWHGQTTRTRGPRIGEEGQDGI